MSLTQLSQLIPYLPNEELQQVLDYASTLSKPEAVSHFSNLLGNSPGAVDFISSFNSQRKDPTSSSLATNSRPVASSPDSLDAVPKTKRREKKKQAIHTPKARQVDKYAGSGGNVYNKKDDCVDYIPQTQQPSASSSKTPSGSATATSAPKDQGKHSSKPLHYSAGHLISDLPKTGKQKSNPSSRSSTPKPAATKISISGGVPMAGQSTALKDLDAAIRALEITTNPTIDNPKGRKCNCVATRHPLQGAAPNCLSCGKVICMKEGLGPCTFCGTTLLSSDDVHAMIRELKDERGREKMAADARANRKAEVSKTPAPFTQSRTMGDNSSLASSSSAEIKAREHRDKLLNFQAENAQRTTVRDEAADFDFSGATSGTGGNMWASPEERARELKRQQKLLREVEWNARPDYEKRQQVVSIDLVGGKVVRRMATVERPVTPEDDDSDYKVVGSSSNNKRGGGGAFSGNPLLGSVIKPVYDLKGKSINAEGRKERKAGWRRVQDDQNDNEGIILDGGAYGYGDEPECG